METGSHLSPPGSVFYCAQIIWGQRDTAGGGLLPSLRESTETVLRRGYRENQTKSGNFQNNCASVYQGFLLFCSESAQSPRPSMRDCNSGSKPFVLADLGVSLDI